MANQSRQPAGIPTGGQFAAAGRRRAPVTLGTPPIITRAEVPRVSITGMTQSAIRSSISRQADEISRMRDGETRRYDIAGESVVIVHYADGPWAGDGNGTYTVSARAHLGANVQKRAETIIPVAGHDAACESRYDAVDRAAVKVTEQISQLWKATR